LADILRTAIAVEGQGAIEEVADKPGFHRLRPPPRWEALARQTLTIGTRTDRMQLVFDSALVEDSSQGPRVLRLKKYEVLMRLGHPIMRQAMATLTRQLHDPTSHNPIFRWSVGALHKSGFEALMAFHYTVTATNELREPLHDEVLTKVFRVEGDHLSPVEPAFEQTVLAEHFLHVHSADRRERFVRSVRARWLSHRQELEAFLHAQEADQKKLLSALAKLNVDRELAAARESYRFRLKELQDRSREQELSKLAKELVREQAEANQPALFEDMVEDSEVRLQEIQEQMAVLR
jgi:hypothetical protein